MVILKRWASRLGMRLMQWAIDDPVHLSGVDLIRQLRNMHETHKALSKRHQDELDRRNLSMAADPRRHWPSDQATGTQP